MKTIKESDKEYICDIQAPCFQSLDPVELEMVKSSRTQVMFKRGDTVAKQGVFASYILFVVNGLCRQYIEGPGDKRHNLRIVQPGEFIGLTAVFNKNIYGYSVAAITDCHAFLVEKDTISSVIEKNGRFGMSLIKRYCEQNSDLFSSMASLLYKQMNGRMAETLLYLDSLREPHPDIFQLLSRRDIAEFAAVSVESAVKLLKSFERDGMIELSEREITITDRASVVQLSLRG
ncbi:MAG: Crp/Fnr family transcriptional regulator [Bacteroidales bacterium]